MHGDGKKRRKQPKPARISDTTIGDGHPSPATEQNIEAGTVFGPFEVDWNHPDSPGIELCDIDPECQTSYRFGLTVNNRAQLPQGYHLFDRLTPAASSESIDVIVIGSKGDPNVFLLIVRSVLLNSSDPLFASLANMSIPMPDFLRSGVSFCPLCSIEFTDKEGFLSHLPLCLQTAAKYKSYASFFQGLQGSVLPPVSVPTPFIMPPSQTPSNLNMTSTATQAGPLFLPISIIDTPSDQPQIRVLGPPQTVIPVAVNRQVNLNPSIELSVHRELIQGLHIPNTIPIGNGLPNFCLKITQSSNGITPTVSSAPSSSTNLASTIETLHGPTLKRRRVESENASIFGNPLDLSAAKVAASIAAVSTLPSIGIPPLLPLLPTAIPTTSTSTLLTTVPVPLAMMPSEEYECECGILFKEESVFAAHQNFYCPKRPQRCIDPPKTILPKFPQQCLQCDFKPNSASQLSQHVRQKHSEIKGYMCRQCCYRGNSPRGIKNHIREVHNINTNFVNDQEAEKYYLALTKVTPETPCQKCGLQFPLEIIGAHACSSNHGLIADRVVVSSVGGD